MDLVIFILGIIVDGFIVLFSLGLITYFTGIIFQLILGLLGIIFTMPFRTKKFDDFWREFEIDLLVRRKKLYKFYSEYLPWISILIYFSIAFWLVNRLGIISTFTSNFR